MKNELVDAIERLYQIWYSRFFVPENSLILMKMNLNVCLPNAMKGGKI